MEKAWRDEQKEGCAGFKGRLKKVDGRREREGVAGGVMMN